MTEMPRECARLAAELRMLRDRRKLTLSALAAESAFSKSSWQRYLTGRALPPWPAVRTLCRLANEPEPRLRALWELAESSWNRRDAVAPATPLAPAPALLKKQPPSSGADAGRPATPPDVAVTGTDTHEPVPRRRRSWWTAATASAAVTSCVAFVALAAGGWGPSGRNSAPVAPSATGFHVGCSGVSCDGRDPGQELCGAQPQTLLHVQPPTGAGLEIRYNPRCRAAWARVWNAVDGDTLTFAEPGRPTQRVTVADLGKHDPFVYTDLIAVSSKATRLEACLTIPGRHHPARCYSVPSP